MSRSPMLTGFLLLHSRVVGSLKNHERFGDAFGEEQRRTSGKRLTTLFSENEVVMQ